MSDEDFDRLQDLAYERDAEDAERNADSAYEQRQNERTEAEDCW